MKAPNDYSCNYNHCRADVLPLLHNMHKIISSGNELNQVLKVVLQIMETHMHLVRGMISLFDRDIGEIRVFQAIGLSEEEQARGVYALGEGITGKVVETGQPVVIPRVREEKEFLNRAYNRTSSENDELSFICVPLKRGKKVLGAISAERKYDNPAFLQQDVELLDIIAGMIAQEAELYLLENRSKSYLERERYQPDNIIGSSRPMMQAYSMVKKLARADTTVMLLGESGVGKELFAGALHYASARADKPFVCFNCGALPESLVESELFGHEKGSFTGAVGQRKGRFETANGGTLFMDEVGELDLSVQVKLLRVLQERRFERVGSNQSVAVDIRIIAATNRDLIKMVKEGSFREDLYYRLNVFPIVIPPLRERGSDIITLADHFLQYYSEKNNKQVKRISTPALQMLFSYHWPGNVRELENVIERAVIISEDEVIHGYDLPPSLQTGTYSGTSETKSLEARLQAVEYEAIIEALKDTEGNMTKAAERLGFSKRIMGLRLQKYGIRYQDFRTRS